MPAHVRQRRVYDPATTFPTIEPGELAVNTANRQLSVGDADPATSGVPLPLLAIRMFDQRASYTVGDYVVYQGQLYHCTIAQPSGVFNPTNFELVSGDTAIMDIIADYLPLTGGTLSGPLFLDDLPSLDSEAANKKYVDDQIANVVLGNVSGDTIINTPSGGISADTVQGAIDELDAEKVDIAGDTMTGQLVLPATAVPGSGAEAARRDYVDAVSIAFAAADTTLQSNIDGKVSISGSTMTGNLGLPLLPAPANDQAVRRDYVDAKTTIATGPEYIANSLNSAAKLVSPATAWAAAAPVGVSTPTLQPNFSNAIDYTWQLNGACTLSNPLNVKPGQKGVFYLTQGAAGSTVVWDTFYKFPGGTKPTLSAAIGAVDDISYTCKTLTEIHCFFSAGMA